jgi:hypothetical protein
VSSVRASERGLGSDALDAVVRLQSRMSRLLDNHGFAPSQDTAPRSAAGQVGSRSITFLVSWWRTSAVVGSLPNTASCRTQAGSWRRRRPRLQRRSRQDRPVSNYHLGTLDQFRANHVARRHLALAIVCDGRQCGGARAWYAARCFVSRQPGRGERYDVEEREQREGGALGRVLYPLQHRRHVCLDAKRNMVQAHWVANGCRVPSAPPSKGLTCAKIGTPPDQRRAHPTLPTGAHDRCTRLSTGKMYDR